ncbi:MAG: hypothetical protein ACTH5D_12970 [Halomonas sp.]|uniref:hypothetical protein n=1 Tax=Halomonas sp. TaxID=1486246 RepID=UPI003F8EEEFC
MITNKITKEMEDKFLQIIYQRYTQEHGYGTRKLSEYKVLITGGEEFEEEMPEIVEHDQAQNMKRYLLVDILDELRAKGYLNFSEDNIRYWLSPKGYEQA